MDAALEQGRIRDPAPSVEILGKDMAKRYTPNDRWVPWSASENATLRKVWGKLPIDLICERLHWRTEMAIKGHAKALGLTKKRGPRNQTSAETRAEIVRLRRLKTPYRAIAKSLSTTPGRVAGVIRDHKAGRHA